jgi:hypothetical protein
MGAAYRMAVPGAIIGSLLIALFGFLVTANLTVPASAASPAAGPSSQVNSKPQKAVSADKTTGDQAVADEQSAAAKKSGDGKGKKCKVSSSFPQSVRKWCDLITEHADKNNLEPDLLAALIWQESGGNPGAYSKSGEVGLMQVMPKDGLRLPSNVKTGPASKTGPRSASFRIRSSTSSTARACSPGWFLSTAICAMRCCITGRSM